VRAIKPGLARLLTSSNADVPIDQILGVGAFEAGAFLESGSRFSGGNTPRHDDAALSSVGLREERPRDLERLSKLALHLVAEAADTGTCFRMKPDSKASRQRSAAMSCKSVATCDLMVNFGGKKKRSWKNAVNAAAREFVITAAISIRKRLRVRISRLASPEDGCQQPATLLKPSGSAVSSNRRSQR